MIDSDVLGTVAIFVWLAALVAGTALLARRYLLVRPK